MFRIIAALATLVWATTATALEGVPRYQHVVVIVLENKDFASIFGSPNAPNLNRLADEYGNATRFYGEVHPSEANYVALLGGDTFGIHDDDAYYCKPGAQDRECSGARGDAHYVDHTAHTPHLGDQLQARGLTWRAYFENLPAPGSLTVNAGDPAWYDGTRATALYASKHSGFTNFESAQKDPLRTDHWVGFDRLDQDLASGALPNFAFIVPNQCNEMHGLHAAAAPSDCASTPVGPLIKRGDKVVAALVERLMQTPAWKGPANMAIVITFDEGAPGDRSGCCSVTPGAQSNYGGGHIPTLVLSNHGPRHATDPTPYNHYSLLRTIEDAFGVDEHLGRAADSAGGVKAMVPLWTTH